MTGASTPPRGGWKAPITYDSTHRWPNTAFGHVRDPQLRAALLEAANLVRVLLRGMGLRRLSERELAAQARVERKAVRAILAGASWPTLPTMSRLLGAVGATLRIEEEEPEQPETGH